MSKIGNFLKARLWTIFTCLAILVGLMVLWIITPSTIVFRPSSWTYDPATGTATFVRVVNTSKPLHVRWAHIVYPPTGPACVGGGTRPYDSRVQIEIIKIGDDLKRCLDQPGNVAVLTWSPLLFNLIPLRPFALTIPAGAEIPR